MQFKRVKRDKQVPKPEESPTPVVSAIDVLSLANNPMNQDSSFTNYSDELETPKGKMVGSGLGYGQDKRVLILSVESGD